MKRFFLNTILATLGINILFPIMCYMLYGIIYVFEPFDVENLVYSSLVLVFVLLASYTVIRTSRRGVYKYNIEELFQSKFLKNKFVDYLFAVSIFLSIVKIIMIGGFAGLITGEGNSGIISYIQLFLNIHLLHFFVLLKAYRCLNVKKIILIEIVYLISTMVGASRSGIFWIVFFNMSIILSMSISEKIKRKIVILAGVAILFSPVLFAISTNIRDEVKHSSAIIAQTIVARLSYLEVASIEMEQYLNDSYQKTIFQDKYGIENQVKQCINSIVPGDLFEYDVQPNQYWRAVFSGWSLEGSKMYYTSINMVLPIYFIYKFGIVPGIAISVLFIYYLFWLVCHIKDPAISSFLSCFLFYTLFQYFDWCYHFQDLISIVFTLLFIKFLSGEFGKVKFVISSHKK